MLAPDAGGLEAAERRRGVRQTPLVDVDRARLQQRRESVRGREVVGDAEIREALSECIATIINGIRVALERTPPELSADISDRGIVLTGGGALIKNLDKRIREETGLPVSIADDPLASVVLGTGRMLSDFKLLRKISID